MAVSSWTFIILIILFTTKSSYSSPVIDRHKKIPAAVQQAIISETSELGNETLKVVRGPKYVTVTDYKDGKEVIHKNGEEVEADPTYYGVVFFLSTILAGTCLFGIACVYEYKRFLFGYLKRGRTFLRNVFFKCSWSPHHKSCKDHDYCSYYRSTDNLIDTNKHFIHFVKSLTPPEENKLVPDPNDCFLCDQYKRACDTCSNADLQNVPSTAESLETTVFFDKETEMVKINMPRRPYLKPCESQLSGCECNGMVQSEDDAYAKMDYGFTATINAEQNNRKANCVGNLRRILVKGKKRNGKNPRHVTFPPLPDLEIVHEF